MHRTQARGRPSETTPRGKNNIIDPYPLNQPCGLAAASHAQWQHTHQPDAVLGQTIKSTKQTPRFYCGEVASHSKNVHLLQPREEEKENMQAPGKASCPSLPLQPSVVAVETMRIPCMAMQQEHDLTTTS